MLHPRIAIALALLAMTPAAHAQGARHEHGEHVGHDEHDEHDGHLHFSHPLVTESPSPDTKLRLDYLWTKVGDAGLTERAVSVEGEYAFVPSMSLAVTVPYVWRSATGLPDVHGAGNTELSLKGASLRFGERGVLVGGGLSAGLPTGSDASGIGTGKAVELEPFADVAWKHESLELVGFGHYSTTVRNPAGSDAEHELVFDGSVLQPVGARLEALLEFEATRASSGGVTSMGTTLAPGLKLYPFRRRALMAGVSVPLGVSGERKDARGIVLSAFYHF